MEKIKKALQNADGTYNGKVIAGLISLLIVLAQQLLLAFGIKFPGDWNAIVAVVNTILTILGLLGVVSGGGVVSTTPSKPEDVKADDKNISAK